MRDYYQILGVAKDASKEALKKAYRELAKEHHPDKHKGDKNREEKFKDITEAYNCLSDDAERAKYDASRMPSPPPSPPRSSPTVDSSAESWENGFRRKSQQNQKAAYNPFMNPNRPPPDMNGVSAGGLFAGGGRSGKRMRRQMRMQQHAQTPNHLGSCPACGGSGRIRSVRSHRQTEDRCPLCG